MESKETFSQAIREKPFSIAGGHKWVRPPCFLPAQLPWRRGGVGFTSTKPLHPQVVVPHDPHHVCHGGRTTADRHHPQCFLRPRDARAHHCGDAGGHATAGERSGRCAHDGTIVPLMPCTTSLGIFGVVCCCFLKTPRVESHKIVPSLLGAGGPHCNFLLIQQTPWPPPESNRVGRSPAVISGAKK